ncbi:MAG TPA: hypothetical protein VM100_11875 [Longimicrobiales bacterium]|nr:hypothetical protein [Longimicrobiales bacterium]
MSNNKDPGVWAVFKALAAFGVFVIGLCQYEQAQHWKRIEFLDEQVKLFDANGRMDAGRTLSSGEITFGGALGGAMILALHGSLMSGVRFAKSISSGILMRKSIDTKPVYDIANQQRP